VRASERASEVESERGQESAREREVCLDGGGGLTFFVLVQLATSPWITSDRESARESERAREREGERETESEQASERADREREVH
jgi:hypothetical protein